MERVTRAGHDDDVTMTAVAIQPDWARTLLTPLLDLSPSQAQHRRVLAVVTYLYS